MKAKKYTALIIDQDLNDSEKMRSATEKLFTKTYIQNDPDLYEKDLNDLRPDVVFMNINLSQREASFKILERNLVENSHRPLIFAYADTAETELIAHTIENGVQDVFLSPYDPDIIASKLNRFIQNEEAIDLDLTYVKLYRPLKAEIEIDFKIVSIDENGFTLSAPHYISKGTKFELATTLTREIFGIPSINMMVSKTWLGEEYSDYLMYVEPKDPSEVFCAALRRYITSKI